MPAPGELCAAPRRNYWLEVSSSNWQSQLHPATAAWFQQQLGAPTEVQQQAWSYIASGRNTLIAAPTGSGKTLAAFLLAIDQLVRQALAGSLAQKTELLYISPLKALSNDIDKNLQQPLAGINQQLVNMGLPAVSIDTFVRTGDTSMAERARAARRPPHIVVTTPESLFIMLCSQSGRNMLASVRWLLVDEIHALIDSKRGAHLSLSLERLQNLCRSAQANTTIQRVGLSATQKPLSQVADFLTGGDDCALVDLGHKRDWDLQLELPRTELSAMLDNEAWGEIYDRLAQLAQQHKTTLVFVNTRRLAERAAHHLAERLGAEQVATHHGSLSRQHRLQAEQRLKAGELGMLVATASLELGIDIGDVDLVCQIASTRRISTFLQRAGRSGHRYDKIPKARLFPISRDDLVECVALLEALRTGELDSIQPIVAPLDVLAQQLVGEIAAAEECQQDDLYALVKRSYSYKNLQPSDFERIVRMLAEGYDTRRGRRNAYVYHDSVNKRLRPRRGARLTAITNAGTIPDNFDSSVILEPANVIIGTVSEDFAFESLPGNIFKLGDSTYRINKIETGAIRVEDAANQPPNIPFWFGEAPARSDELSAAVARLRSDFAYHGNLPDLPEAVQAQLKHYLATSLAALGVLPDLDTIVFERFFDQVGDTHLVIHSVYGARVNRAWGLALRKRFCRNFNFELQAAASEDSIVLSLGPTHSFPLEEVKNYLAVASAREVLIQALLDSPMFTTRWRWVGSIALALPRRRGGKAIAPQLQRMNAEDLIALVFPDQLACLENIVGEREVPDHPLINQTIEDCLTEVMDVAGFLRLLQGLHSETIKVVCRDLRAASPLAQEILMARPNAFLDDGEAEERRTQAVVTERAMNVADAAQLGQLDAQAISSVRKQAWPQPLDADELHDALLISGALLLEELNARQQELFEQLQQQRRALLLRQRYCCAHEREPQWQAVWAPEPDAGAATELVRGYLSICGPTQVELIAQRLGIAVSSVSVALAELEREGMAMQGSFDPELGAQQWCDRVLLARIHRLSVNRLRAQVEAISKQDFVNFLICWQRLDTPGDGSASLSAVLQQLEGFAVPASLWERSVLPARLQAYRPEQLDELFTSGRFIWRRRVADNATAALRGAMKNAPVYIVPRAHAHFWLPEQPSLPTGLSSSAQRVYQWLDVHGACFFQDISAGLRLLASQCENALAELAVNGLLSSDNFAGVRALMSPETARGARLRRRARWNHFEQSGRWQLLRASAAEANQCIEHIARVLLQRYGVVFRALLANESPSLPKWRELVYCYRRLEARGEIRGGYFVSGISGEQYALPEVLPLLRRVHLEHPDSVGVSSFDPLNLSGIISSQRLPAQIHAYIKVPDFLAA